MARSSCQSHHRLAETQGTEGPIGSRKSEMAVDGCSARARQLEFCVSRYFDVQQLSAQVRQKWEQASLCTSIHSASLEEIVKRQQAAEEKRLRQQSSGKSRTKAAKRAFQSQEEVRKKRAQKLEEKLAVAEVKRQNSLDERRMKATAMLQRTQEVAERVSERQSERAARLGAKLEQAERVRESQIAAAAAKGGDAAAHAKAVSAAARAREEAEASKRKIELELRLQRAEEARHELTQTVLASLAPRGVEPFLVRRALTRSILRRQSSSRVLQRCWRAFAQRKRTTTALVEDLVSTEVPLVAMGRAHRNPQWQPPQGCKRSRGGVGSPTLPATPANTPLLVSPGGSPTRQRPSPVALIGVSTILNAPSQPEAEDPFEEFAEKLQSPTTLSAATALLRRLALKLGAARKAAGVESLLKRLFPRAQNPDRYPARVFLCAYMILKHPKVVFSQKGDCEEALIRAAAEMVAAFEALLGRLVEPPTCHSRAGSEPLSQSSNGFDGVDQHRAPTTALLTAFDSFWLPYLEQFVAWKLADAASLEAELVRVAVEMEASKLAKLGTSGSQSPRQSPEDRQALVEQVARDHQLLTERIQRLGGQAGVARLEAGLAGARAAAAASSNRGTPPVSPGRYTPYTSPPPPTTPVQPTSTALPAAPGPAVTNESLAWELLYDLNFQLPSEEAESSWRDATEETDVMQEGPPSLEGLSPSEVAATAALRVRRIAEKAFWDSMAGAGADQVAGLLSELATQLVEALPPGSRVAAQIKENFEATYLRDVIAKGDAGSLLPAFEQLAKVLHEVGSPARQQPAMATHARIMSELQACSGDQPALGRVLVRALRLMAAQLRLLQVDMSNATLRMLASSLASGGGIRYAQQKFRDRHAIAADSTASRVSAVLPHTRAWLAQASSQLQGLQGAAFGYDSTAQSGAQLTHAPIAMRTGRAAGGSQMPEGGQAEKLPAATYVSNAGTRSWRGLVRVGLVSLATADQSFNSQTPPPPLAETLSLDAGRIHEAKEAFQHLVVLATCLMVVRQTALDRRLPMPIAAALKPRLKALLTDQKLGLHSLATELAASIAGGMDTSAAEASLSQALQRMLARGSSGLKALGNGFSKVLQQMLLGNEMPDADLQAALARYGAGDLADEARCLAKRLQELAAVSEAVHEDLYKKLAERLL